MADFRKKYQEARRKLLQKMQGTKRRAEPALDALTEEAIAQSGNHSALESTPKKAKLEKLEQQEPQQQESFQAANLQEHILGSREAVYMQRMQRKGDLSDVVLQRPQYKDVIEYISSLPTEEQPAWYKTSTTAIVENDQLNFPNPPVLTRSYIEQFLCEPKKNHPWERLCSRQHCVAEEMAGFRCRELLFPDDLGKVMSVEEQQRVNHLPRLVGWCFFCHLAEVTKDYLEILRLTDEKRREAGITILHMFIVQVNLPGEYKLEKTCMGDDHFCGIFGPVPLFTPNNYKAIKLPSGQRGFVESDDLVFH